MQNQSQFGDTILLRDLQSASSAKPLTRIHFMKSSEGAAYNEAWLQNLIMLHPGLLPINQIERAFSTMVPVCTELPMRAGFVDNLFVTPTGDVALVECKLWRNPEARREVIAQIIDYASEMTTGSYESLESAIRRARLLENPNGTSLRGLFEIVSTAGEMDEATFHDAVSRNLKRGRFLLLIVGDGIREGLETMTEFLQQHAGLHFTLSIVELALFEVPGTGFIAQPRVLARTTNIERGVVTLRDSRIEVSPPSLAVPTVPTSGTTITQEHFFEDLEKNSPGTSEKLRRFLAYLAEYNVLPDYGSKTLTLRWHLEDSKDWNLAAIVNTGDVWMDYHGQQARNSNLLDASKEYLQKLATLVPGATVKQTKSGTAWNLIDRDGHSVRLDALLVDDTRKDGWIRAISRFQAAVANSSAG
jgi:hypothetical protein